MENKQQNKTKYNKSKKQILIESDDESEIESEIENDECLSFIDEIENITSIDKRFINYINLNKIVQNKKFKIIDLFKKVTKYGESLVVKTNKFTTILPSRFNKLDEEKINKILNFNLFFIYKGKDENGFQIINFAK